MAKIVLISNKLFHYRINIYKKFKSKFLQQGFVFNVLAPRENVGGSKGEASDENDFIYYYNDCIDLIKSLNIEKPDIIINFLHLTDKALWVTYLYALLKKVPNIYWNHGINLQTPSNRVKLKIFQLIHSLSSAIILYSSNEKKYIKSQNQNKVFVANNTIDLEAIPEINETKITLKESFGFETKKIVLFVGRIQERKKLDILIDVFQTEKFSEYLLLIVGGNMPSSIMDDISKRSNIKYLGEIYDQYRINSIFKMADLFCIPGTNGLGLNQAMYWSLPCLTLDVRHSPEIVYLKQGKNGFIAKDKEELKHKLLFVLENDKKRIEMGENAKKVILEEASIDKMYEGFASAINYVSNRSNG